jgi:regulator of sigma E protease
MDYLIKVGAFVLVFGLLIVFHEFGHFAIARLMGVRVLNFAIGFGPVMVSWKRGHTEYSWRLLPLGGYVKMLGDDPTAPVDAEVARDPEAFHNKAVWQRALIVAAGPIFNFLLPLIVLFGSALAYESELVTARVGTVVPGGPAEAAGLLPGDRITHVNGAEVLTFDDLVRTISDRAGQKTPLKVQRGDQTVELVAVPREVIGAGAAEIGIVERFGRIMLYPGEQVPTLEVTPGSAAWQAGLRSGDRLQTVSGTPVKTWRQAQLALQAKAGQSVELTWTPLQSDAPVPRAKLREAFKLQHKGATATASVTTPAGNSAAQALGLAPGHRLIGPLSQGSAEDKQLGLRAGDVLVQLDGQPVQSIEDAVDRLKAPYEAVLARPDYVTWPAAKRLERLSAAMSDRAVVVHRPLRPAQQGQMRQLLQDSALISGQRPPASPLERWVKEQPDAAAQVERGWLEIQGKMRLPVNLNRDERPELTLELTSLVDRNAPEVQPNPHPIAHAFRVTGAEFWRGATIIAVSTAELLRGNVPVRDLGGPLRMAQLTSEAADRGFEAVLRLIAWLSINLGILNLLPIPLVDGGHLLFLGIEAIKREPVSLRTRQMAAYVGLTFLGLLFLVVMKNDGQRLLQSWLAP